MLKSKASPGASSGSPTQAADAILPVSNMPRAAATTQPTPIPTRGPQKRSSAEPRSIMAAATTIVTSAVNDASSGADRVASSRRSKTTDARVRSERAFCEELE